MVSILKKYPKYIISVFVIVVAILSVYKYISEINNNMTVSFLDVGQGDSVLIEAPNGNRVLYDAGTPDNKAETKLSEEIPSILGGVDIFIASHSDADHIGGFKQILSKIKPLYYIDNNLFNMSSVFVSLEGDLNKNNIERYTAIDGEKIDLGSGVIIDIISPDQKDDSLDTNESSVSIMVSYGKNKILLTGDLEEKMENKIVEKYGSGLSATILKAGHHGSKTSTSNNLLKAVKPNYVVISVGKNNKYGHPNDATIGRIKVAGAQILSTAEVGTIKFECDGDTCIYKK